MGALARAIVAVVVAGGLGACTSTGAFECEADEQCQDGSRLGRCESSGWCSFPDATCDSGYKYGTHAGEGLADACVDPSLGSSGDPTGPATTIGTTTNVDGPGPLDSAEGDTTTTTATTATTEPLTSGPAGESSSGAASEDTGEPVDPAVFIDRFDRPDDLALGNGWVEKTPTAFQLVDGRVVFESSAGGFQDNLWYRDESELDVEVCIELQILAVDPNNHPQVHARMQPDDIAEPGQVTAYILFVEGPSLALVRVAAGGFQADWSEPLSAPLEVGPWYRLCMIVVGTDPVELEGRLWVEQASGWVLHTELLATDGGAARITQPGATGSSAADAEQVANLVYDDFMRTILVP
jgi:hypothetical protein